MSRMPLDAGVDDFLRLPFSPATLHRRLNRIMDSRIPDFSLLENETAVASTAEDLSLPNWLNDWGSGPETADVLQDDAPLLSPEEIRAILNFN